MMDSWKQYLFESHPEDELRSWARRLRIFRFFRAYGGHANDGDSLDAAFAYQTTEQLESFLGDLGVDVVKFDVKPPQPELGVTYQGNVFAQFPSLVGGTRWMQQPGHCEIMGIKVFIWCAAGKVQISLCDGFEVSEKNVIDAEKLEARLADVALARIDPPADNKNYVCPKYYPHYFDE